MNARRIRLVIAGMLLAPIAPRFAAGQDMRLSAQLDPATAARVGAVVDRARAASLPTEPLVDKALEGARKRADPGRILDAVSALAVRLDSSRAALGGATSESELVAGASALQAGIDPRTLRDLRAARGARSLAVPLVVLGDLVTRGVPADTASALILLVAREGLGDETLLAIQRDVQRDVRDGAHPATAAAIRARGAVNGGGIRLRPVRGPVTAGTSTLAPGKRPADVKPAIGGF
ncbi:MAG TPA: hypothetical protein VHM30_06265 [Gemmatimonadaceae bacterium]|nr:hypothetical protein [Gemmatimonadaceae bacterium]